MQNRVRGGGVKVAKIKILPESGFGRECKNFVVGLPGRQPGNPSGYTRTTL